MNTPDRTSDREIEKMESRHRLATDVSICVATYNRWDLCLTTLKAVSSQTGGSHEIILVDDASTDPMPESIRELIASQDIRYIRHPRNVGLAQARNTAINHAKGTYFTFCDDDDVWPPGHLAGMLSALREHAPVAEMAIRLPEGKRKLTESILEGLPPLTTLFIEGFTPPVASQMYKLDLVRRAGAYSPATRSGVDHDLWVNLMKFNPRVAVTWGSAVQIATGRNRSRMTTDEIARTSGIRDSMNRWRPTIVATLGEDFFRHFQQSYQSYLDNNFFNLAFQHKRYLRALLKAFNWNVIKIQINRRLDRRRNIVRPSFFPAFKGHLPPHHPKQG